MLRWILGVLVAAGLMVSATQAQDFSTSTNSSFRHSQVGIDPNDSGGGQAYTYKFINLMMDSGGWGNAAQTNDDPASLSGSPSFVDQNGNVLSLNTPNGTNAGWSYYAREPLQAERPGNYILTWAGDGSMGELFNGGAIGTTQVSCSGVWGDNFDGIPNCNNEPCNTTYMTGYISGHILTVVTPPSGSCQLAVGIPVSDAPGGVTSLTYNNTTGEVDLAVNQDLGIQNGQTVIVAGIGTPYATMGTTGTVQGAIQALNITDAVVSNYTRIGPTSATFSYTAPTGLCGSSATALSCSSGVYTSTTTGGDVESTIVNTWAVPTVITGLSGSTQCPTCTGTGGTGTYYVNYNYADSVGSAANPINLTMGGRMVISVQDQDWGIIPPGALGLISSLFDSQDGRPGTILDRVRWNQTYFAADETDEICQCLTPTGTVSSPLFRQNIEQTGAITLRDLGPDDGNAYGTTTWEDSERPPKYVAAGGFLKAPRTYTGYASYDDSTGMALYTLDWYDSTLTDKKTLTVNFNDESQPNPSTDTGINFPSIIWTGDTSSIPVNASGNNGFANVTVNTVSGSGSGAVMRSVLVRTGGDGIEIHPMSFGQPGVGYAPGDQISITLGGVTVAGHIPDGDECAAGQSDPTPNCGLVLNTEISIDGGVTFKPLYVNPYSFWGGYEYDVYGNPNCWPASAANLNPGAGCEFPWFPQELIYDAQIDGWLIGGGSGSGSNYHGWGMNGAINPGNHLSFAQLALETGTNPWYVGMTEAAVDPSDFYESLASYLANVYPTLHPTFETTNESWNGQFPTNTLMLAKTDASESDDPTVWLPNDNDSYIYPHDMTGKEAAIIGESVCLGYGGTPGTSCPGESRYTITVGVQTTSAYGWNGATLLNTNASDNRLVSPGFYGSSDTLPAGFIHDHAYNYETRVNHENYWAPNMTLQYNNSSLGQGTAYENFIAWKYLYQDQGNYSGEAMSLYSTPQSMGMSDLDVQHQAWETWATQCGSTPVSPCGILGTDFYEGGDQGGAGNFTAASYDQQDWADTVVSASGSGGSCTFVLGPQPTPRMHNSSNTPTDFTAHITGTQLIMDDPGQQTIHSNEDLTPNGYIVWDGGSAVISDYDTDATGSYNTMRVTDVVGTAPSGTDMEFYSTVAAVGQNTLELTGVVNGDGGTWNTTDGTYNNLVVSAVTNDPTDGTTVTVNNLNCASLGTLSSANLVYVGSATWVNDLRWDSWMSPQVGAEESAFWNSLTSIGGINPSWLQITNLAGSGADVLEWAYTGFDVMGYWMTGLCGDCTLSGTTLTLNAGNNLGVFRVGSVLMGQGVNTQGTTGKQTHIIACSPGPRPASGLTLPCGSAPGDVLTLDQAAYATNAMVGQCSSNGTIGGQYCIGAFTTTPTALMQQIESWNH